VELVERAAQAVPGKGTGALLDVAVEQRPDADPERRDECRPDPVDPSGEKAARACGIREQGVELASVLLLGHGLTAQL
jgi:hypothetical protein